MPIINGEKLELDMHFDKWFFNESGLKENDYLPAYKAWQASKSFANEVISQRLGEPVATVHRLRGIGEYSLDELVMNAKGKEVRFSYDSHLISPDDALLEIIKLYSQHFTH